MLVLTLKHTHAQSLNVIAELDQSVGESSGLLVAENRFITHNDSGGAPIIYEIDPVDGAIVRTVFVENATNVDWEDICRDENHLFIADIGNNAGSRSDLAIYRISIAEYLEAANDTVQAEIIGLTYSDQTNFDPAPMSTNFDAETIVAIGDSLWIFSKNWTNSQSNTYSLSKIPGSQIAHRRGTVDSEGLVTGGSYDNVSQHLILCGHTFLLEPFLINIDAFGPGLIAGTMVQRTELSIPGGISRQVEAIDFSDQGYYLTSEAGFTGVAALMRFEPAPPLGTNIPIYDALPIYPNPTMDLVTIPLEKGESAKIYDQTGKLVITTQSASFSVMGMRRGTYIVVVENSVGTHIRRHKFVVEN